LTAAVGYDEGVSDRDFRALDGYAIVPRLLHDVHEPSTAAQVAGLELAAPILPFLSGPSPAPDTLSLLDAEHLLNGEPGGGPAVAVLRPAKMGDLMPQVRKLAARRAAAIALDLTVLADVPPYGAHAWRPKTREDLAELVAAAGCPLWLYGVAGPADAEVAVEAGVAGVVVDGGAGKHLGTPATPELFPEVFDAVAGMTDVLAGGAVRDGVDVFRYLALGAEAVVVRSERPFQKLHAELVYAMRLTGCATLADVGYDALYAPLFGDL
jgi:isopentenyl diphosphate isomerase/L-lactate dehydrogenase-like FMN-dependent dehydrogenase